MASITIDDVARLAGVSIKTVSRVLNAEPHVRAPTRDRVLQAVDQLNYHPNASARALAGSRSYLLALILDNPSQAYSSQVEQGALSACRAVGYHLIVEAMPPDAGPAVTPWLEALRAKVKLDGLILTPPLCDRADLLEALEDLRIPCVRIAPSLALERTPRVYMDDAQAAYDMTVHLHDLGHRDIAFIAGPEDHRAAASRRLGYERAMTDAGLSLDPNRIAIGAFSFRSGWDCGERLLRSPIRPSAIFASNDDMALGVMAVAHRLQIDVPRGLSIVGFDDTPSATVVWPQLTTVRQPVADMAARAVELLVARSAAPECAVQLPFELVLRDSSAAPQFVRPLG